MDGPVSSSHAFTWFNELPFADIEKRVEALPPRASLIPRLWAVCGIGRYGICKLPADFGKFIKDEADKWSNRNDRGLPSSELRQPCRLGVMNVDFAMAGSRPLMFQERQNS